MMGQTHIIENYAEHPYEFPQGAVVDDKGTVKANRTLHAVIIPWRVDASTPSKVRVSDETLKLMQADPGSRAWFGQGQLQIGKEPATKEEQDKIPTQPSPPVSKVQKVAAK